MLGFSESQRNAALSQGVEATLIQERKSGILQRRPQLDQLHSNSQTKQFLAHMSTTPSQCFEPPEILASSSIAQTHVLCLSSHVSQIFSRVVFLSGSHNKILFRNLQSRPTSLSAGAVLLENPAPLASTPRSLTCCSMLLRC